MHYEIVKVFVPLTLSILLSIISIGNFQSFGDIPETLEELKKLCDQNIPTESEEKK